MDLSGNESLLRRHKVAIFASRNALHEDACRVLEWAENICKTDCVVISGFHSPLEKQVLDTLLKHKHPIIYALGRGLYKRIPPELVEPFGEGRLLFISFHNLPRHSWSSAQQRNWLTADLADEVYFSPFDAHSSLSTLHYTLDRYSPTPVHIL